MTCAGGTVVVPGEVLVGAEGEQKEVEGALVPGSGTYELDGKLYASVVGKVIVSVSNTEGEAGEELRTIVSVATPTQKPKVVPVAGSIVTCRVTKVTPRFAVCDIVCVGTHSVPSAGFKGMIRKENVRSFEIDRVEMHGSFRPGDIVRAQVASLGTARSYELTTAEKELGVVSALSAAEASMVAISFEEMKCPVTGVVEKRKVAKLDALQEPALR